MALNLLVFPECAGSQRLRLGWVYYRPVPEHSFRQSGIVLNVVYYRTLLLVRQGPFLVQADNQVGLRNNDPLKSQNGRGSHRGHRGHRGKKGRRQETGKALRSEPKQAARPHFLAFPLRSSLYYNPAKRCFSCSILVAADGRSPRPRRGPLGPLWLPFLALYRVIVKKGLAASVPASPYP
jgi:hypothetical protein